MEPELPRIYKVIGGMVVIAGLVVFSMGIVFVSAPLNFSSLTSNIDYSLGPAPAPGGIAWRSVFVELDLMVTNPTGANYDNIDILVRPDYPVAKIAQFSNLSDVSFEDSLGATLRVKIEDLGTKMSSPMVLLATDAGYRVHCGRIPPNSGLRIVMAVVDIKKTESTDPKKPIVIPSDTPLEDFSVEGTAVVNGDTFTYWLGSEKNLSVYAPGAKPQKITVSGSYTATYRRRNVTQEIIVR